MNDTNQERLTVRYIYMGRRLIGDKLTPAWARESKLPGVDDLATMPMTRLPKVKGSVVGGIYTVDEQGDSYFPASASYTGEIVSDDIRTVLEATAHAAEVRASKKALERNHARQDVLKDLCAPLREVVGKQVGYGNRAAVIAYITTEISRG